MLTRRFNCPCVGVSEVVGVSSTVSFDFVSHVYRENQQDECLSKIPVTGIHADKISAARKKEKMGVSSSEETEVISVRERERIRQRTPFVFFPGDRTLWGP